MLDLVLGAGQGGSRIAKAYSKVYNIDSRFFNLTDVDFSKFDAAKNEVFVLNEGGTGRDPEVGEALVKKNKDKLYKYLADLLEGDLVKRIALCVGGGGGSGTGFMFPILDYLLSKKKNILLVYTLPQKKEGLPAQPNALRSLNRLIEGYIGRGLDKSKQVSPLIIDNDYCLDRYGMFEDATAEYWSKVNTAIAFSLKRFYNITNLGQHKTYFDMAAGYNSLDYREFLKVLFFKEGFLDIREMAMSSIDEVSNLSNSIKSSSLVNSSMDINTTKAYLASVAIPQSWVNKYSGDKIRDFQSTCFEIAAKLTKTPWTLGSSYFSPKLQTARVSLLLAGLTKSHGLDKHIKNAMKNVQKFKDKGEVSSLSLDGLDF